MARARLPLLVLLVACGSSREAPPAAPKPPPVPAELPSDARAALDDGKLDAVETLARRYESSGDTVVALALRGALAEHRHDEAAMRAVLAHPDMARLRQSPRLRYDLARAVRVLLGFPAAKEDLDAACASLPEGTKEKKTACSHAVVAAAAEGRPTALSGATRAELDFLPKVPIPIVMMSVAGKRPAPFIVDTGAAGLALSRSYCDAQGIPYREDVPGESEDGGGNPVPLYPALVASIEGGGVRATDVPAVVIQFPPNLEVGGIVAPHRVFAGALVELDLRREKLRVARDVSLDDWVRDVGEPVSRTALAWADGNVFVRVRLERDLEGWMNFDTGAVGSIVTLETMKALGREVDRNQATESVSITKHASFPPFEAAFAIGEGTPAPSQFVPIERNRRPSLGALGNVGATWMKGRRIAIGPDGRTLAYTAAVAPASAPAPAAK